jgi:hypothetical protein
MYVSSAVAADTSKLCFCMDCINVYAIIAYVDKAMLLITMLHGLSNLPTTVCINHVAYFLNGKLKAPPFCLGDLGDLVSNVTVFDFLNMDIFESTTSSILSSHL